MPCLFGTVIDKNGVIMMKKKTKIITAASAVLGCAVAACGVFAAYKHKSEAFTPSPDEWELHLRTISTHLTQQSGRSICTVKAISAAPHIIQTMMI